MSDFTDIELSSGCWYEVPTEVAVEIRKTNDRVELMKQWLLVAGVRLEETNVLLLRFESAFRGIASCSTCEVCRNVAQKQLDSITGEEVQHEHEPK